MATELWGELVAKFDLWIHAYRQSLPNSPYAGCQYQRLETDFVGYLAWDRVGMEECQPESLLSWSRRHVKFFSSYHQLLSRSAKVRTGNIGIVPPDGDIYSALVTTLGAALYRNWHFPAHIDYFPHGDFTVLIGCVLFLSSFRIANNPYARSIAFALPGDSNIR